VDSFFKEERIDYVFLAAAKVGGIKANNDYPTEFLLENLQIQNNIIPSAYKHGVKKLIFLGSSCIYPRDVEPQPIKESNLLGGPLEATNEPYAIAKIAGIKLCQALHRQYGFNAICAMPTNLYGPGDNFHPTGSHVLPALIRRTVEAKEVKAASIKNWGSGAPRREFLHVDDLAAACLHLMDTYSGEDIVNVGCGTDVSIKELAEMVAEVVGYQGNILWDTSKPDGTFRKLLDVSKLEKLGWKAGIELKQGIEKTVTWYLNNKINGKVRL
jgi:GDP-L-fucose synthase